MYDLARNHSVSSENQLVGATISPTEGQAELTARIRALGLLTHRPQVGITGILCKPLPSKHRPGNDETRKGEPEQHRADQQGRREFRSFRSNLLLVLRDEAHVRRVPA